MFLGLMENQGFCQLWMFNPSLLAAVSHRPTMAGEGQGRKTKEYLLVWVLDQFPLPVCYAQNPYRCSRASPQSFPALMARTGANGLW